GCDSTSTRPSRPCGRSRMRSPSRRSRSCTACLWRNSGPRGLELARFLLARPEDFLQLEQRALWKVRVRNRNKAEGPSMKATFDVLLLELLKREDALPTSPAWHGATGTYRERVQQAYAHNQQLREAEVGPAWSSCEWFGALRAADRMSWSRLLKRAEA